MLKDKAILVSLTVNKPKMSEKDKQATTEVAIDKQASAQAIAVVKRLYPKHLLAPITECESAARRYIESMTQPWARGLALLPSKLFMEFQATIGGHQLAFNQAVTVFMNNYANVMIQAQAEQGTMFDQSAYPDLSDLRRDFSFGVRYIPLADVPSIALDLEAGALAELKQEIEGQTKASLAQGQKALYARLSAAIERIAVQCSNPKGKIFASLTGNVSELLSVLPALNLADDPVFDALCNEAKKLVVAPEAIRTVPEVRESLAKSAEEILTKMAAYL